MMLRRKLLIHYTRKYNDVAHKTINSQQDDVNKPSFINNTNAWNVYSNYESQCYQ